MSRMKMSFGRRLQRTLAVRLPGNLRWKGFRLAVGDMPLRQLQPPYLTPGAPGEKRELAPDFDAQRDEAVFRIDHGYATDHGVTLTASAHLIRELSREWNPPPTGHSRLEKPAWLPRVHRLDEAASITLEHNENYCHFLFEGLPRLHILERCGIGSDVPVYANAKRAYQRDLLPFFGVPPARLISSSAHPLIQAKRLWVPTYPGYQGKFPQEAVDYLRGIILPKLEAESPLRRLSRKLYISRRDSTSRRILNEAEVETRLQALGFECLCLSDLPVLKQLRAFAEARVVVAAHGASLTNIAFCAAGASMIEIFPQDFHSVCYQDLAPKVGVKPSWLRAASVQVGSGGLAQDLTITEQAYQNIIALLHDENLA